MVGIKQVIETAAFDAFHFGKAANSRACGGGSGRPSTLGGLSKTRLVNRTHPCRVVVHRWSARLPCRECPPPVRGQHCLLVFSFALPCLAFADDEPKTPKAKKPEGPLAEASSAGCAATTKRPGPITRNCSTKRNSAGRAAIGIARTWQRSAMTPRRSAAIEDAIKKDEKNANLLAARADICYQTWPVGRRVKDAEAAIKLKSDAIPRPLGAGPACPRHGRHQEGRHRDALVRPHLHASRQCRQADHRTRTNCCSSAWPGRRTPAGTASPTNSASSSTISTRTSSSSTRTTGGPSGTSACCCSRSTTGRRPAGVRQRAQDQPERGRGTRRQGARRAAAVRDQGRRAASPIRRSRSTPDCRRPCD